MKNFTITENIHKNKYFILASKVTNDVMAIAKMKQQNMFQNVMKIVGILTICKVMNHTRFAEQKTANSYDQNKNKNW